jgi:uncharacterized membrane protein
MYASWPVLLLACGLLIIAIILVMFWHPRPFRTKIRSSTDRQRTNAVFRDDNRYCYGGFLYNNPDDPDLFVPKRFGLGWTINFGHPQAKLALIGMLLVPLLMASLGAFFPGSIHPSGCHPPGCQPHP